MRHWLRLIARGIVISTLVGGQLLLWLLGSLGLRVTLRGRARRQAWFGSRVLALFRALGATFIKVGQIMSTRPDLLPPHIIKALEKLQDQVGAFAYRHVERTFREDFGVLPEQAFASFSRQPIASASVAQVHEARLPDGTRVAVKVRRPRVAELAVLDLAAMRLFARVISIVPSIRLLAPVESVDEFGRGIMAQVDFTVEAANNRRFTRNFAGDPDVEFPVLVPDFCSVRVLTMGFVAGVKVLDGPRRGSDPKRLARIGFHTLLKMVFEDGFVHADLHPGNIFVTERDTVALLDLGLVAELDDVHRRVFARYFASWAMGDGKVMARMMIDLSPSKGLKDYPAFEAAVMRFVARYHGKALGELHAAGVFFDMMGILRKHRVRVNAVFTMVNIALAVCEGIGKQLAPELDMMAEALPFFARLQKLAMV